MRMLRLFASLRNFLTGIPVVVASGLLACAVAGGLSPASATVVDTGLESAASMELPRGLQGRFGQLQQGDAHVLIELKGAPGVVAYSKALGGPPSRVSAGARSSAVAAAQAQVASNKAEQAAVVSAMQGNGISYKEIYRVQSAMNGIAAIVPAAQVAQIRRLPGVKAVRPIVPSVPMSLVSVPFVGANQVWQGLTGIAADGTGIKVGIIDTGIDYQHANFGGTGLLADYQKNDRVTLANNVFPTAKVVGGTDLAGDNYDANGVYGSTTPTPDPNPTDCNGHGSHVAGTAAGLGVTTTGTTYTGPYDTWLLESLRMTPGVAPKASLYAIRVFGCGGSTDLVVQAIDWALDPNGDADYSDHLDVINMSLGLSFGGLSELDTIASENASLAGMNVVASAGNSYDTYLITGSPGSATRTLSVAASLDGGEIAGKLQVTAPSEIVGGYFATPAAFGPAIPTGAGLTGSMLLAAPNLACTALTNAAQMAGKIAIVDRGTCAFQEKVRQAEAAGAVGVIVVNNSQGVPGVMAGDGGAAVNIPAAMISKSDGALIKAATGVVANLSRVPGADLMASFSSRGPNNGMPIGAKPGLTAPGVNIVSTQTGMTCLAGQGCQTPSANGYLPGSTSLTISGTSMAAPHVAGLVALLKQLHPTFTVEQINGLAENGAIHDLTTAPNGEGEVYGGGRAGAGRIDAVVSANLQVSAYNADGSGSVGVTFPPEVFGNTSVTKKVRVTNNGLAAATFALNIDTVVDNPGVAFSLPGGSSLTLAPGQSVDVDVKMTGTANQIKHTFDPSIFLKQTSGGTDYWRYFMTEETAYLEFLSGGLLRLRVPLYMAPYPAGSMSAGGMIPTGGAATGTANISLAGTPVCTGTYAAGPPATCTGTAPLDEVSLVKPFELQASVPRDTSLPPENNLKHIGVASDGTLLHFAISQWGPFSIPNIRNWVEVTLVDGSDNALWAFYATRRTDANGYPLNLYPTGLYRYANNTSYTYGWRNMFAADQPDTRVFQSDVYYLSVPITSVGLTSSSTARYYVDMYDMDGNWVQGVGPLTFNLGAPGLNFGAYGAPYASAPGNDLPGATIPVAFNVANLQANGSLGGLLMHFHNQVGSTAEVLTLPPASVAASGGTPQSATIGTAYTQQLQATVTDALGNKLSGVSVTFTLPASGASGAFPGNAKTAVALTDASGVAKSPAVTANMVAGAFTATAAVSGVGTPANFSLSNTFGAPAAIVVVSGGGQSAQVGAAFGAPIVVQVNDAGGNPVTGATVNWSVPTVGASATLSASSSVTTIVSPQGTMANGVIPGQASVTATASLISGAYKVRATVGAFFVDVSMTNTIAIAPAGDCASIATSNAQLIEQYYAAILRRPSDTGGKAFWLSEANRLCGLGVDPKQTFIELGNVLFNSPEYIAQGRDDTGFVTDLYVAFFGRLPDAGGLAFWVGQLGAGNPRNNVMNSFLFSTEFSAILNALFPGRTARAETYTVMDMYGGFFRRLPDSTGYTYWTTQLRAAQCAASPSTAVFNTVNNISSSFMTSPEYAARNTSNSQFVQDLYYAMLQRGGDLSGFNNWVTLLNVGLITREQMRVQFMSSPEMAARINAVVAQGCLP